MNHDEAKQHGLGYAAGREDASGTPTAIPPGKMWRSGWTTFADAYAQGWYDFNAQRRCSMTSCRDAYDRWQESGGRTIFRKGDLTLSEADRAELNRMRPGAFATTGEFTAYWERQAVMQDAAWAVLMHGTESEAR